MIYKILTTLLLIIVFFFLETAISFSYRSSEEISSLENQISFALRLENKDSDYESFRGMDHLINSFLEKNKISGASVAITKNDSLVYAKGFGLANKETGELIRPGHLFRIASISKLITAVAILKLFENGELALDDKVFGPEGILNDSVFVRIIDPGIEKITVRHLLNHTAGWSQKEGDPAFSSLYIASRMKVKGPVQTDTLIRFVLGRKLAYKPGTHYAYSNFGYIVLGRIVEKITGMNYEDYVCMKILSPLDIKDMHIGRSLYHEKLPNEVMYFEPSGSPVCYAFDGSGKLVPLSYGGNNIGLLGAAGGWVASAPELIKFLSAIDGHKGQPDILSEQTIKMMTNPRIAGNGLFGWRGSDRYGTWWRTGTLTGSTALIMRQDNGINWVVLLNSSFSKSKSIHNKISRTMFSQTYKTKDWPGIDLFTDTDEKPDLPIGFMPLLNPEL